jgi:predicted O-methyltransferase YrrM
VYRGLTKVFDAEDQPYVGDVVRISLLGSINGADTSASTLTFSLFFPAGEGAINSVTVLPDCDRNRAIYWLPIYHALWKTAKELNPRRVVEIGTRAGQSSWTFLSACPEATIHGIDLDAGTHGGYPGAHQNARRINAGPRWSLQIADSRSLEFVSSCDLLYIDGDHSEEGCYADLQLGKRSGVPVMLVDDFVNLREVRTAVRRFMRENPGLRGRFIPSRTGLWLIERASDA